MFASPSGLSGLSNSTRWSKQNQLLVGTTVGSGQVIEERVAQPAPTENQLEAADGSDPALTPWLKLPPVSGYVRTLTDRIIKGAQGPYARARAISDFFASAEERVQLQPERAEGRLG